MAKKTYTVKTAVEHDGKPFAPGEPIDLEEAQAKPLLEVQAIEPAPEVEKKGK